MQEIFLRGTLELIISLVITGIIVFRLGSSLKRKRKQWFLGGVILSLISTFVAALVFLRIVEVEFSAWWVRMIQGIVSGYLPGSMFIFVMFAGALKKDHPLKRKMMSIRTELSILATILYLPHTILYTALSAPYGIKALFAGNIHMKQQLMTWSGLINSVLLIVLGVTSPDKIKAKLSMAKWKLLHKWSYLFYFNCFVHYMSISFGRGHYERVAIYLVIYGTYFVMRLHKAYTDRSVLRLKRQTA